MPVTVESVGPGMFKVTAKPESAGVYVMRAGVNGSFGPDTGGLHLPLEVKAAPLSPEHCQVLPDERSCGAWVAGGTARLTVHLADQFGNPVHDIDASQLDVSCTGPGKVQHTTNYGSKGRCTVHVKLTARAAGRYEAQVCS